MGLYCRKILKINLADRPGYPIAHCRTALVTLITPPTPPRHPSESVYHGFSPNPCILSNGSRFGSSSCSLPVRTGSGALARSGGDPAANLEPCGPVRTHGIIPDRVRRFESENIAATSGAIVSRSFLRWVNGKNRLKRLVLITLATKSQPGGCLHLLRQY